MKNAFHILVNFLQKACKSPKTPIILLSQKIQRMIAYYKNYIDKKTYGREGITG